MAARQINDIVVETEDGKIITSYKKSEWMVDEGTDVADIPKVAAGSVAYTADLTFMAMFDGENWITIGGSD